MHTVQTGLWDPRPPSRHASPVPAPPSSSSRLSHVTTDAPAKRITFYKSGDSQFGGIRMAVHKRTFKCFDALLDDLSQKVPLPFGVRTVTTPRGIHAIKHLEQLQDGACYLCSDRRQAKPIDMEMAGKRPTNWYHHSRRPQRPETSSTTPPGHLTYRQRRILLVKNSEPGMRRSVVLSRRSTRSLRAFLDEVSDVMQFHVRKLYTAEGRRIDSVQSLMTCPGLLVCVGREAFSPMLINFIRKSSEEKLPGLGSRTPGNGARSPATQGARSPPHGAQSRASEYSEGHDSKKNVNFGLETKKSIIHPRSDSSNRSTRFSLSSDKSCGNGMASYSQARPAVMNDDIEKRVLVNKDGSLSVEMRVRFRLHNDETLQWSTQIKKSPSLTNDSLSQPEAHYLQQGQSGSCSDPDSTSFDPEHVDYSSQPLRHALDTNHCPCCYQRRELQYELWENPAHSHKRPPVPPPHPRASSHTHTIMRHTHSSSSSSSCNSRRLMRCRAQLSSCRAGSASEHSQLVQEEMCVTERVEQDGDTHVEMCTVSRTCSCGEALATDSNQRAPSRKSAEDEIEEEEEEEGERPVSAVSSSSHILQALKDNQDDEDDELPPSASQCCHCSRPSASPTSQVHTTREDGEDTGGRAESQQSSRHCRTASSSQSKMTRAKIPNSEEEGAAGDDEEDVKRVVSGFSGCTGLSAGSQKPAASSVCSVCGGCKQGFSSVSESRASQRSHRPHQERPPSVSSCASHMSNRSHNSTCNGATGVTAAQEEERSHSAVSAQSKSCKSNSSGKREQAEGEDTAVRAVSSLSARSDVSAKTSDSVKSQCQLTPKTDSPAPMEEQGDLALTAPRSLSVRSNVSGKSGKAERPSSNLSAKSSATARSGTSHKSTCSHCGKAGCPEAKAAGTEEPGPEEETEVKERPVSATSAKSNLSVKSNKSCKSNKTPLSPRSEAEVDEEERAASQTSARTVKSNTSVAEEKENESVEMQQRPDSVRSAKNHTGDDEDVQDRAASDSPAVSAKAQVEGLVHRTPSAMSKESQASARCSATSTASHKLNPTRTLKSVSPSPNAVTIKTPEREPSTASVSSHQSNHSGTPDTVAADADVKEDQMLSPRGARSSRTHSPSAASQSPGQQLLPGGDTRGPSGLSVKSTASAKSGRSKCRCGASSAKKVKEGEDGEAANKGDTEEPEAERAASGMSSASKQQRRESGGTDQAPSRNSLESVSLCLPEDQETAGSASGKSSVCIKDIVDCPDVSRSPEESCVIKEPDEVGCAEQQPPAVDIPTIETPGESKDEGEEAEKQNPLRTASASSADRSSCKCHVKVNGGNNLETGSVKSSSSVRAANMKTSRKRTKSSRKNASEASSNNGAQDQAAKETEGATDNGPCCLRPKSTASSQSKQSKGGSPATSHKSKSGSSGCTNTPSSEKKEASVKSPSKAETCSESPLSHSLSAADLLRESMAAARPRSCQSKASKASDKGRSEKSGRCQRSRKAEEPEVTPSCLPNASPSDVVSEWLRSIPANSTMLAPDDELNEPKREDEREEEPAEEAAKEEELPEDGPSLDKEEETAAQGEEDEDGETRRDVAEDALGSDAAPAQAVGASCPNALLLTGVSLPRSWPSSAAVMKVLLSSSLGRCHSMPEVSPVYGRRLSTSARGLLGCLAQLQLIEPAVSAGCGHQKNSSQQFEDIMAILQSLWLTKANDAKEAGGEQVTTPRSSSGVDMSSGSAGSGKENGNQGDDESPPKEEEEAEKAGVEGELETAEDGEVRAEEASTEPGTTDVAEEPGQSEELAHLDSPKATGNPSSSDQSSPTGNEQELLDETSSGTPPTVLRAPLAKRLSQDPDPVWVLHLLKKLEKQFINHYSDAMAEFKVRWDLDDSLILNTMMKELRDEVSKRIQSSIEREVRKIQSRAGRVARSPRPPQGMNLSRESTMTEKRRRMLKVMKNQSVKTADSFSDEDVTGHFSDQRSDDDYCPCDACVRKKMAARPLRANPAAAEAPVMMEFDLLKILQLKKSPSPADVAQPVEVEDDEMENNLEVVQEEEEENAGLLEETVAEAGQGDGDGDEAGADEEEVAGEKEGNSVGGEEQEEGDTGGEVQQDEVSDNGEQEEEEGDSQCCCHCERNDEEDTEAGAGDDEEGAGEEERETGNGGEESDRETVKEATTGEAEIAGNGDCEEEGAIRGSESGEEEDDSAAKDGADGKSDIAEGHVSTSAEADGTGGDTEEQEGDTSEVQQGGAPAVCAAEGEEADAGRTHNESDAGSTAEEGAGGEEEVVEDGVEGFKPGEDEEGEEGALLHQFTRASVESQPGSLEDVDSPQTSTEVPRISVDVSTADGKSGASSHNPKTLDNFELVDG